MYISKVSLLGLIVRLATTILSHANFACQSNLVDVTSHVEAAVGHGSSAELLEESDTVFVTERMQRDKEIVAQTVSIMLQKLDKVRTDGIRFMYVLFPFMYVRSPRRLCAAFSNAWKHVAWTRGRGSALSIKFSLDINLLQPKSLLLRSREKPALRC